MENKEIYLDHAATTYVDARVKEDLLGNEVDELIEEAVTNITQNNNLLVSEGLKINDKHDSFQCFLIMVI